jgi:uncharacterized protein DUF4129
VSADALVAQAGAAAHRSAGDLETARRAAADSIQQPGSHHESLLTRLLNWIGEQLARLLPDVTLGAGGLGGLMTWLVLAALAAGCLYAIVRAVRDRPARRPREAAHEAERRLPDLPLDRARAQALRLADADPVAALRLLYPALIAELLRRRGWRAVAGRTNWAVVRRVGPRTPQGSALTECTRLFESAVYGRRPASRDDVVRVDELSQAVLA